MNVKTLLASSAFMMSAALVISLLTNVSGIFPGAVLTAPVRSTATIILLAAMLTLALSRIPTKNLSPLKEPKSLLRAILLGLVISAIIPVIGYLLLKDTAWSVEAIGLVFIAATPFAASVAPLSFILRGDLEHALRSTIVVYVLSLVWIPFIIWALIGQIVDMTTVAITVIEIIAVPLVLSRLITKVKIDKDVMAITLNCVIFILVWLSVSSTMFPSDAWILLGFAFIALLRTFGLGLTVEAAEKKIGIKWSQRVTDILMTSYKNKGIAIALCAATMGPLGLAGQAMVAIATSIIIEICWVIFMDSVLFSKKRMVRELESEGSELVYL
jgi:bile acid:Na+ symporter, BASS family